MTFKWPTRGEWITGIAAGLFVLGIWWAVDAGQISVTSSSTDTDPTPKERCVGHGGPIDIAAGRYSTTFVLCADGDSGRVFIP